MYKIASITIGNAVVENTEIPCKRSLFRNEKFVTQGKINRRYGKAIAKPSAVILKDTAITRGIHRKTSYKSVVVKDIKSVCSFHFVVPLFLLRLFFISSNSDIVEYLGSAVTSFKF